MRLRRAIYDFVTRYVRLRERDFSEGKYHIASSEARYIATAIAVISRFAFLQNISPAGICRSHTLLVMNNEKSRLVNGVLLRTVNKNRLSKEQHPYFSRFLSLIGASRTFVCQTSIIMMFCLTAKMMMLLSVAMMKCIPPVRVGAHHSASADHHARMRSSYSAQAECIICRVSLRTLGMCGSLFYEE